MDQRVKRILEYDKIVRQISEHAVSPPGAQLCFTMQPSTARQDVARALMLTQQADAAWTHLGGNPMQPYHDCVELLDRCAVGATPSPAELLQMGHTLRAVRIVQNRLRTAQVERPLWSLGEELAPFPMVENEIFRCIQNEEEVSDDASPQLRQARRQVRQATERVRTRLQEMITSPQTRTMLQDHLITMRNGRYVVPVKAEYSSAMKGLVHDRSASGSTVFIEPLAVLEANNELRELQAAERREVERILQMLGGMLGQQRERIAYSLRALTELDVCFAKAGWGRAHRAVQPELSDDDTLLIKGARHPLIAPEQVVPIDLACGGQTRALIITGPNTGGKTVTLKTAGLFAMLAQSGVFLPCNQAVVPCYQEVFADIGDEQSIEQSLSTFSSHMVNIVEILQKAENHSLVLVDELGVGTDPVEGAALAIAILQQLVGHGASVIATTHYSELKSFAMTADGFVNAGMEFDLQSLKPTYRLMIGYAGSSNAFEISRRLGLSDEIIHQAQSLVNQENARLERALSEAEQLRIRAQQAYDAQQESNTRQRAALHEELQQMRVRAQREERRAQETLEKARRVLEQARQEANEAIEAARAAARAQHNAEREQLLQKARTSLKQMKDVPQTQPTSGPQAVLEPAKAGQLLPGDQVYVLSLRTDATILGKPDSKGNVYIQAGVMKLTTPLSNLRKKNTPQKASAPKGRGRVLRSEKSVPMELDVRGTTVEEAKMVIGMHLDAAVLAGMQQTSIIHGKGTGALRNGVRAYLQHHPHVKSMRSGLYGEGEEGVTVVELK